MNAIVQNWIRSVSLKWILIGAFSYVVTIVASVYLLLNPQFRRYQEAVDKQVGLNDTYINLVSLDLQAAIDSTQADWEALNKLKSRFHGRLLGNKTVNAVLPVIDRYCTESRLKVEKLEPLNKTTFVSPGYQKQFIEASLKGGYSNFLRLLEKLEANPEWILVEKLKITRLGKSLQNKFDIVLAVLKEKGKA